MKSNYLVVSILLLALLLPFSNQSLALEGKDVWKENSQIIYEYDYKLEWHSSFLSNPLLDLQNYDFTDEDYRITYIGIYEDKMFFKKDSKSELLYKAIGLDETQFAEDLVDSETGFDSNSEEWSGYFYDTKDFEIGSEINDIKFSWEYEDSTGIKSINKKYKVDNEEKFEIKLDSVSNKEVDAWRISVNDFDLKFSDFISFNLVEFTYSFKNLYYIISSVNGVILEYSSDITLFAETERFLREVVNVSAIESKNVNIDKSQIATSSGFEILIVLFSVGTIIFISKLNKKKNP